MKGNLKHYDKYTQLRNCLLFDTLNKLREEERENERA